MKSASMDRRERLRRGGGVFLLFVARASSRLLDSLLRFTGRRAGRNRVVAGRCDARAGAEV
jgi:hypothetical protein